jgi:hypothetical protein
VVRRAHQQRVHRATLSHRSSGMRHRTPRKGPANLVPIKARDA